MIDDWKLAELKQNLQDYVDKNLTPSKSGLYCCPKCGSGTGSNNNYTGALGIFTGKDGTPLFKCQACGATGSIIDLIMITEGLDKGNAIRRLRELYDPSYNPYDFGRTVKTMTNTAKPQAPVQTAKKAEPVVRDFRNQYRIWHKAINDTDYATQRGLDKETINRFNLGFASEWTSPTGEETLNEKRAKEGKPPITLTPSPRLIIPVDANHYTARDTRADADIPDWAKDHKKMKEGKDGPLFNPWAMNNPLCFFCVEGEIDAMSIEQAGGACVAFRSAGNKDKFCQELKKRDATKTGTVIIVQDNDPTGEKAGDYIENFCKDNGFLFTRQNVAGQYKDVNDYLVADRLGFEKTVKGIIESIRRERMAEYLENYSAETAIDEFMRKPADGGTIPTGFPEMDKFLDGGLHPGLYFLGAVSSIGKTTFCLQIAEQVATAGRDVLFFSLEQSKDDLISKSLSRRTYERSMEQHQGEKLAKTNINILRREKWKEWTQGEWDNLWICKELYGQEVGRNLIIIEAVGDYGVEEIAHDVERHIAVTGHRPLVIIDYLQIMKPYDERMADKQNVDRTTSALKRLSRDNNITILAISSFNRESYWTQVTLTSFKESGSIEYSSDCLLALSPLDMKDATDAQDKKDNKTLIEKTKTAKVRKIELLVLKNRNGRITSLTKWQGRLLFEYTAMFNHFKETKESYLSNFDNGNPDNKTVYM